MDTTRESSDTRKSRRLLAAKTTQSKDYVYYHKSESHTDSAASTSTNTSAHNIRDNLLATTSAHNTTTTTTMSTQTMSMPSHVSTTNTIQSTCATTPIITTNQNTTFDLTLMNILQKLDTKLDANTSTLNVMKDEMQSMFQLLNTKADVKNVEKLEEKVNKLQSELNDIKTKLNTKTETTDITPIPELVKQEMNEQNLIKIRKNNLIIKNLPEQNDPTRDTELCQQLLQVISPLENNKSYELRRSFRLGKLTEGRNRFYKITFENPQDRRNILAKSSALRELPPTNKFQKAVITSDLTPTQLKKSKNLKTERDQAIRRDASIHWVIFRGKVMADTERDLLRNLPQQ